MQNSVIKHNSQWCWIRIFTKLDQDNDWLYTLQVLCPRWFQTCKMSSFMDQYSLFWLTHPFKVVCVPKFIYMLLGLQNFGPKPMMQFQQSVLCQWIQIPSAEILHCLNNPPADVTSPITDNMKYNGKSICVYCTAVVPLRFESWTQDILLISAIESRNIAGYNLYYLPE